MKTALSAKPRRLGAALLTVAIGLGLLPFLALCWYAHPSADDFLMATQVGKNGHFGQITYLYTQWTGRYTSAVLWALLHPVTYGFITEGYGLVCLLTILAVPVAGFAMLRLLLGKHFSRGQLWSGSGLLTLLFLFQMPSPAEAFYWVTSNYNYLLPAVLTLVWLGVLAQYANSASRQTQRNWLVAACLLAVAIVGGNETNAVPLLLGTGAVALLSSLQQRRIARGYVVLALVVAAACAATILAPGNFVRLDQSTRQYTWWQALDKGGLTAYRLVVNWLGNGVLAAVAGLLAPVAFRLSKKADLPLNRLARRPLLMLVLMAVSLVLLMFVAFWTTSLAMPPRSKNVLYLFFLVWWFLHAYAWARYFWRKLDVQAVSVPRAVQVALVLWIALVFAFGHTRRMRGREPRENANNIVVAYRDWLGGAAARYDRQLTARYAYLHTPTPPDVVVARLQEPPATILFSDLETNPNDWANQAYAEYFGKRSIRIPEAPAPAVQQP
ncbi:DUF6056 family protein [Hymenobacter latericus]|uniref:DUF6056 family protein n=1 Tax=Hymenobacter sp. YIM 151858-1 TaxID=2987688 RepID=UPI002225E249|nr:DUF6056 family protein [Hymenobacter sp. YIM 151858-1]UYZ58427.1 DUF6056 family protein [Hymenobacter sp. YIM 151858-1]